MAEANNIIRVGIMEKPIMHSNYCVNCWPKKEYASLIYMGNSVCDKHFEATDSDTSVEDVDNK